MEAKLLVFGGGEDGTVMLPDALFARRYNPSLAHQVLTSLLSNARLATRKQKTRAEVSHTTRKLFRQKGTGRARGGHSSTNIRRGGGRAFPASPNDNFYRKVTRKMYRAAMAVVLSQLLREERLHFVRALSMESHKTRDLVTLLSSMQFNGKVLLVDEECDDKLSLAVRNLSNVYLMPFRRVLLTDFVDSDVIVFSERVIKQLAEQSS